MLPVNRYASLIPAIAVGLACIAAPAGGGLYAYGGKRAPVTARRVMAPDVKWVSPGNRVAVFCDQCATASSKTPGWLLRLGSGLNALGLDPVLMKDGATGATTAGEGFVAVLDGRSGGSGSVQKIGSVIRVEFEAPLGAGDVRSLLDRLDKALSPDPEAPSRIRYLFLVSDDTDAARVMGVQASWAAHYAKLDADFVRVAEMEAIAAPWLRKYSVVAVATDSIPRTGVSRLQRALSDFMERGGGVVALAGLPEEMASSLLGIDVPEKRRRVTALACDGSWLPGASGLEFELPAEWMVELADLRPGRGARPLCTGLARDGAAIPAGFVVERGAGRMVYWQLGLLSDKSSRGLILLSLLEAAGTAVAASLNALVFWVDDCPMPLWNAKVPPLDTLYDMTDIEFYEKLWWPRMRSLFKRFRLVPTFGFILSYDDNVKPPFKSMYNGVADPATVMARGIVQDGHEIALHGYNHQSLTVARGLQSRGWPGRQEMELALRTVRKGMLDVLGTDSAPTAYVAPNNLLQKLGKEAVHEVFPEITAMASQYLDEGPLLGQEFGQDPDLPGITDIPRISSEHFLDGVNAHEVLDALALPGVFSHFIHPDDIRDPERSRGKSFDEMMEALESMLDRVLGAYPFIRKMSATAFASKVREHERTRLETVRGPHSLVLRAPGASLEGLTTLVRLPPGVTPRASDGCVDVHHFVKEGRHYYRVGEEPCTIAF